jgi:hypothetical protein
MMSRHERPDYRTQMHDPILRPGPANPASVPLGAPLSLSPIRAGMPNRGAGLIKRQLDPNCRYARLRQNRCAGVACDLRPVLTQVTGDAVMGKAGTRKPRSTEHRNTAMMRVTPTQDLTSDRSELRA